ncbi:Conserved membrane protein [Paenibacillus pasadenensis]|uniref:Conserved membrane protein n=1 Tax=Paenibacillus pasadenensis TaxID=217090 RepID=A0A2N5N6M0_9BACL|nr:Conserved membrane protein [Paenibacillus pasadenensis]
MGIIMKGILAAIAAGGFITLQGAANSVIGEAIGTWQAAALTQLTGFVGALALALLLRGLQPRTLLAVKPVYATGGALGALIIFGNVTAIHQIGITLTTSLVLLGQLALTFLIEWRGWLGSKRISVGPAQAAGFALMAGGVLLLAIG